jgi:hypothetical protein
MDSPIAFLRAGRVNQVEIGWIAWVPLGVETGNLFAALSLGKRRAARGPRVSDGPGGPV